SRISKTFVAERRGPPGPWLIGVDPPSGRYGACLRASTDYHQFHRQRGVGCPFGILPIPQPGGTHPFLRAGWAIRCATGMGWPGISVASYGSPYFPITG